MAFSINFTTCQDEGCTEVHIQDTSTGWVTDLTFASVTSATIAITYPGGTTDTFDITTTITGASSQDDLLYELTGLTETGDGGYTIVYTITDGATTWTDTSYLFFKCVIECCVWELLAGIVDYYDCNNCSDEYIKNALDAKAMLASLQGHVKRGNFLKATTILSTLTTMCDFKNCDCN